jgi:hypothetical protein
MARDIFHDVVRTSLEAEGWIITADPLRFEFGDVKFQVDLAAEQVLAAERSGEKIAVEIKSFLRPSAVTDFYGALGQFLSYRLALEAIEPERSLYLAIPLDVYESFFQLGFTQKAIQTYQLRLIVYDSVKKEIVQWIS